MPGIAAGDHLVSVLQLGSGVQTTLVSGGVSGAHAVPGIAPGDKVLFVGHFTTEAALGTFADLTPEFTDVIAANTIGNTGGTDTTNDQLMVFWQDNSQQAIDLTAEFTDVIADNTIGNTGGTNTLGDQLLIQYDNVGPVGAVSQLVMKPYELVRLADPFKLSISRPFRLTVNLGHSGKIIVHSA